MPTFSSSTQWFHELDRLYGNENLLWKDVTDDGYIVVYYRTKQWARTFKYDVRTSIGEI